MLIQNEQEAVVMLLYASIDIDGQLTDHETSKIANVLVYCNIFQGHSIVDIARKYFTWKSIYSQVDIIEKSAPYISDQFKPTLYAMLCDILCSDGNTSETDLSLMALIAGKLQMEDYLPIASTFMKRYAYNYNIEEA